jgi:hypothetical protein
VQLCLLYHLNAYVINVIMRTDEVNGISASLGNDDMHFYCILGQKNLEPEEADSLEVSYISGWQHWLFQGTVYWAEYANKVVRGIEFNVQLPDGTVLPNVNLTDVNGNDGDKFGDEDHYNFKYVPDVIISAVWRNFTNEAVTVPEYARRRTVDELPLRVEPAIAYEFIWNWWLVGQDPGVNKYLCLQTPCGSLFLFFAKAYSTFLSSALIPTFLRV